MSEINFGNLFLISVAGTKLDKDLRSKLLEIKPAGIIHFDDNIQSKQQIKSLNHELKDLLGNDLIIAVDQEGGKVERLRKVCTSLPSFRVLGEAYLSKGKQVLIQHSKLLASELKELGFNMVFGPCLDIATNQINPIIGPRALGTNEDLVREMGQIITSTYQECGILTCAKHFPGHGASNTDTHLELTKQKFSKAEFNKHLKPFENTKADSLMIAHVIYEITGKALKQMPASLSREIIIDTARAKQAFSGAIISDDISMQGLGNYETIDLLKAGVNLICYHSASEDKTLNCVLEKIKKLQLKYIDSGIESEDLFQAYSSSKKYINQLKAKIQNSKKIQAEKTDLTDIVLAGMNIKKTKNINKAIFCSIEHPKIELERLSTKLNFDYFYINETSNSKEIVAKLNPKNQLVFLVWQNHQYPFQEKLIQTLNNELGPERLITVSVDNQESFTDIDLYGCNEVHLAALIKSQQLKG